MSAEAPSRARAWECSVAVLGEGSMDGQRGWYIAQASFVV
jgi:hypothetical protein